MKRNKRIMAFLLSLAMVLSTIVGNNAGIVKAAPPEDEKIALGTASFEVDTAYQASAMAGKFFAGQTLTIDTIKDEGDNLVDFNDVNIYWISPHAPELDRKFADLAGVIGTGQTFTIPASLMFSKVGVYIEPKEGTNLKGKLLLTVNDCRALSDEDEFSGNYVASLSGIYPQSFVYAYLDKNVFQVGDTVTLGNIITEVEVDGEDYTVGSYTPEEAQEMGAEFDWQVQVTDDQGNVNWESLGITEPSITFTEEYFGKNIRLHIYSEETRDESGNPNYIFNPRYDLYVDAEGVYNFYSASSASNTEGENGSYVQPPALTSGSLNVTEFRSGDVASVTEIMAGNISLDLTKAEDYRTHWQTWDDVDGWYDVVDGGEDGITSYAFTDEDIGKYFRVVISVQSYIETENGSMPIQGEIIIDAEGFYVTKNSAAAAPEDVITPSEEDNIPTVSTVEGRNGTLVKPARVYLVSGELDKDEFFAGEEITVVTLTSETGDVEVNKDNAYFQWQIFDEDQNSWVPIPGANDPSYTPTEDQTGKYIRVYIEGRGDYMGWIVIDGTGCYGLDEIWHAPVRNPDGITPEDDPDGLNGTPVQARPQETATPEPSEAPAATPSVEPQESEEPTPEETATPEASEEPTAEVTATPEESEEPTPEVTVTPEAVESPAGRSSSTPVVSESPATTSPAADKDRENGENNYVPGEQISDDSIELYIPTITGKKIMGFNKKFQICLVNTKGCKIQCESSNKKIATISKKGLVKSKKKKGKATLIINVTKGEMKVQYIINVHVRKRVPKNYSLIKFKTSYQGPSVALYKNIPIKKSFKVTLKHIADGAKLKFVSSNKKVATVNNKGKIKPKKVGKSLITITAVEEGVTYKYYVVARVTKKGVESKTNYLKIIK